MKHSRSLASAAIAIALLLPAGIVAAKDRKPDNLVPVGEPISCITPSHIRSTRVVDDQTIDFEMAGGKIYRNRLSFSCPSLGFEKRFSYKLSTNNLCSVDIIHVLHDYGWGLQQGAGCGLGKFQQMEKAGK